jgi:hypothetical protein
MVRSRHRPPFEQFVFIRLPIPISSTPSHKQQNVSEPYQNGFIRRPPYQNSSEMSNPQHAGSAGERLPLHLEFHL